MLSIWVALLITTPASAQNVVGTKVGDAWVFVTVPNYPMPAISNSNSFWGLPGSNIPLPPLHTVTGSGGTAGGGHSFSTPSSGECWSCGGSSAQPANGGSANYTDHVNSVTTIPYSPPVQMDPGPDIAAMGRQRLAELEATNARNAFVMMALAQWKQIGQNFKAGYNKQIDSLTSASEIESPKLISATATIIKSIDLNHNAISPPSFVVVPPELQKLWTDTPDQSVDPTRGYKFKSQGPFLKEVLAVHQGLVAVNPQNSREVLARTIGLRETALADQLYVEGETQLAQGFVDAAKASLDVALGFIPVVGFARDTFEAVTGRSLVLGTPLSTLSRAISIVGAISLGLSDEVLTVPSKVKRLFDEYRGLATGVTAEFDASAKIAQDLVPNFRKVREFNPLSPGPLSEIKIAKNSEMTVSDTFRSSTYSEAETRNPIRAFRAFSEDENKLGSYLTLRKPNGPTQAALDTALDPSRISGANRATQWVEVEIPKGEKLYIGVAAPVENSSRGVYLHGGGTQVFVEKISPDWIIEQGKFLKH